MIFMDINKWINLLAHCQLIYLLALIGIKRSLVTNKARVKKEYTENGEVHLY